MDRRRPGRTRSPRYRPHARGDGPLQALAVLAKIRSSPRSWGWTDAGPVEGARNLIVPTLVGMDPRLRISQEEVAHLSGISRPRCNEALRRLKQAGLLRTEYGVITIVDLPGLKRYQG